MASLEQKTPDATTLIATLTAADKIKVWSLLVTVFGDLAQENVNKIPGPFLNQLFKRLSIKPEAVRVALHRLKKDGWIESDKTGRVSEYSLSSVGHKETEHAVPYVYGDAPAPSSHCLLCVNPTDTKLNELSALTIAPRTYLLPMDANSIPACSLQTSIASSELPTWVADSSMPTELRYSAETLISILSANPPETLQLSSMDTLAVRILVLHHWRRIALRKATWLNMALFDRGLARRCHEEVHRSLTGLNNKPKGKFYFDSCNEFNVRHTPVVNKIHS